jgi:hypothetical protein
MSSLLRSLARRVGVWGGRTWGKGLGWPADRNYGKGFPGISLILHNIHYAKYDKALTLYVVTHLP